MKLLFHSQLAQNPHRILDVLVLAFCLACPLTAQQSNVNSKLFAAISQNDLISIERLLRDGANIEARGTNGMTPLMQASEQGTIPVISLFLERDANPNAKDEQGETALSWAARGGWVRVVNLLAPLSDSEAMNHALFEAIRGGPVGVIYVDAVPPDHPQPAPTDVIESWEATVESLLDHGASIEAISEEGATPLLEAAAYAKTDIFKLLVRKGARLDVRDKFGNAPLSAAACQCALATMNTADDIIEYLLAAGADVNSRNYDGQTALMMASGMTGDASVLELLLRYHADRAAKDHKGMTALAIAQQSQRDDKIAILKRAALR